MPKGSVRNPGSSKTTYGRRITAAFNSSNLRDNSGLTKKKNDAVYAAMRDRDIARAARKDIRGDESVSSPAMRKMRENPYAALKRKAASRAKKK